MKRIFPVAAFLAAVCLVPLAAQTPTPDNGGGEQQNRRKLPFPVWKAELPGGSYLVARNAISAVSSQQYVLDGVARVTEVNITTSGNFHPRFYFLEMLTPTTSASLPGAQLAADAAMAAAQAATSEVAPELASKVIKNYPATTHASTIEFRLGSAEQLQKLRESVERTWLTGESEVFTPQGTRRYNASEEIKDANDDSGDGGPGSTGSGTN